MEERFEQKYSYQYGSVVRNLYEAEPISPRKYPQQNPQPQSIPQVRPNVDRVLALKLSLCGLFVFVCTFMYVHIYSTLATAQAELKTVKNQIRETRSTISYTQAHISEKLNLDYIRQRASRELGMAEPLPYQIVYVELPKQSYTLSSK
ncbi:hypothetical protein CS063_07070 [Sporanaerobium hydrogeniformans]|uniref:Uncharacterized protein n=1 Tax=Sporanaerobium hydrogeniformans TaxID=3072179 RepID=A0AC61DCW9_9FIRM|nr:hypothetical protein [Sporanaerobium hydrogeniformans]PHV71085.1 hypothetical protein CS063_07070 [Sporanaerobium hydrogeniformans]